MSNFRSDIFWIYISYLNSALVDLKIHDRLIPIWNYFIEEELIITHLNWNFLVETVHSFASGSRLWLTNTDRTHQNSQLCWSGDLCSIRCFHRWRILARNHWTSMNSLALGKYIWMLLSSCLTWSHPLQSSATCWSCIINLNFDFFVLWYWQLNVKPTSDVLFFMESIFQTLSCRIVWNGFDVQATSIKDNLLSFEINFSTSRIARPSRICWSKLMSSLRWICVTLAMSGLE